MPQLNEETDTAHETETSTISRVFSDATCSPEPGNLCQIIYFLSHKLNNVPHVIWKDFCFSDVQCGGDYVDRFFYKITNLGTRLSFYF